MHSTPKHPLDACIHLCFLNELTPISLFDAFSNSGSEAIIFVNQPERRIHDQLMGIHLKMGRELRKLRFLLRSHADFRSLYASDENSQRQALPVVVA